MKRPNSWKALPKHVALADPMLKWFELAGRSFRWRQCENPYHILCAEVMLQRTRADQVLPVFTDFAKRFSSPGDFFEAGEPAAQAIFSRLGLRWRAKQFWLLNRALIERYGGDVPSDRGVLISLPGIGDYVADAVRLFAFGRPSTLLDSNVLRILGRYYGVEFPDHARRTGSVLAWAAELAPKAGEAAKKFNWSLIDFGALVCTPREPRCDACPLHQGCWFARNQLPQLLTESAR